MFLSFHEVNSTKTSQGPRIISKKIRKENIIKPAISVLGDITNHHHRKLNFENSLLKKVRLAANAPSPKVISHKYFLEDKEVPLHMNLPKTRNYSLVDFESRKPDRKQKFVCFSDMELKINLNFQKIIPHSCDNDCSTDDEQIKGAIKTLYKN